MGGAKRKKARRNKVLKPLSFTSLHLGSSLSVYPPSPTPNPQPLLSWRKTKSYRLMKFVIKEILSG